MCVRMKTHKDLDVWKLGISLVKDVYILTSQFPKSENYGLSSQMQRCSVSIPSNIAEGAARQGKKEYIHFLYISLGSLAELETQIIIAKEVSYTNDILYFEKNIEELRRKLLGFINYLKKDMQK